MSALIKRFVISAITALVFVLLGAVALTGCVGCEVPFPQDTLPDTMNISLNDTIALSGTITVEEINGSSSTHNNLTANALLYCMNGLETGNYYSGASPTPTDIMALRLIYNADPYPVLLTKSFYWSGSSITTSGGNGACDSMYWLTTYQQVDASHPTTNFYLDSAGLGKSRLTQIYPVAYKLGDYGVGPVYHGSDYVRLAWEITASHMGGAHEGADFLTDTCLFIIIQGLNQNFASPINYMEYIYANGDSVRLATSYLGFSFNADSTIITGRWETQGAKREIANDTLKEIRLLTASGKRIARDTADIYMGTGNAVHLDWTINLMRVNLSP